MKFSHRSISLFLVSLPAVTACGGGSGNDVVVLSDTANDKPGNAPPDLDPTESWPEGEVDPTEGCPGIGDVCVYGPDETPLKKPWRCQGSAFSEFNAPGQTNPLEFSLPLRNFQAADGHLAEVMACCDEDYSEGCENAPQLYPQRQSCLKDCAYQLCRKFALDFKALVSDKDNGLSEDETESMKLFSYLDQHGPECQQALLARTDCEELDADLCDSPGSFHARWNFSTPEFPSYEGFVFDAYCEITDFSLIDGYACDGVQANNALPFPDAPPATDDFWPFLVEPSDGEITALVAQSPLRFAVSVADVRFSKQIVCGPSGACGFRLEQMRLDVSEIDLGPLSLVDVRGGLLATAAGLHVGDTVSLPASSLQIIVAGSVESSALPILDGLPFVWIVHNSAPVSLQVTASPTAALPLFGIDSAKLSLGTVFHPDAPLEFDLAVDRGEYSAP